MRLTTGRIPVRSASSRLFVPLLAAAILGCSAGEPTGPGGVVGTYQLTTINGSLPYTAPEVNGMTATLNSGSLVLRDDLSFDQSVTGTSTSAAGTFPYTTATLGTYTQSGSSLSLTTSQVQWDGTVDGNTIILVKGTDTWVFTR